MYDVFQEHVDPAKDLPRVRKANVDDKNDFVVSQSGPHGFWFISREKGQIPDELKGSYTSATVALAAIDRHRK